jgi:hypothetical protein
MSQIEAFLVSGPTDLRCRPTPSTLTGNPRANEGEGCGLRYEDGAEDYCYTLESCERLFTRAARRRAVLEVAPVPVP